MIRWLSFILLLTTAALAAVPPRTSSSTRKSPNIILITLDTTRADRMGFLGSKRGLTPNLDDLANQSAVFTHAYAQVPITTSSHATILTGTYPQFHQVNTFGAPLATDLPYAPEILKASGYHTAAFLGSIILNPAPAYAPGFDRGFDTYDAGFHNERPGQDRYRTVQRRGEEVVKRALAWMARHPNGPFFAWVHLYDAHDPYDPPEPYKTRYAAALYDGAIAYQDAAVGKLLSQLKARGLYEGAVIAVMADHGESLGAHGEDTHGMFLYDETIRVPLVIKLPHGESAGKRIESRVELADVLPTLLEASGIPVPKEVQGQSLLGMMTARGAAEDSPAAEASTTAKGSSAADTWRDRPAYAETDYPHTEFGWSALRSLRTGKYLYIQAPRRELYDEAADSEAVRNLAPTSAAVVDTLASQVEAFRQKTASKRQAPEWALDPAAQEKLGALGYMAGGHGWKTGPLEQGPDPKDKIEIANMIHRAEVLQQDMHSDESIALLQEVMAKEPQLALYGKLGEWLMRKGEFQKAVPVLRKAVEADPYSPMARVAVAKALMGSGDFEGAVPELEFAAARVPNLADAQVLLELAYARTNRVPETIQQCKVVLQLLPDHFGSYLTLGRFLELSGDLKGAVTNLRKAAALEPKAPDPHLILSDVYGHLGRKADAQRERTQAERLQPKAK